MMHMINRSLVKTFLLFTVLALTLFLVLGSIKYAAAQPSIIKDTSLKIESIVSGLSSPTSMAFIDNNNILVLEKSGQVCLVSNGQLRQQPVLQVTVDTESERGLLGIAIMNNTKSNGTDVRAKTIFLYYTESQSGELRNRIYKYEWNGQSLVNPKLILDLPALPGPNHDAGKIVMGPDNYLYAVIGDLNHRGNLQNIYNGPQPDDAGVILRINASDGSSAPENPFSTNDNSAMHRYYAYGIRNSFGMTFDPITGSLWDTENGPDAYDEINIVKPGFNSGWIQVMGPISRNNGITESQLVNFPGSHYADPIFSWKNTVAVTAIEFMKSSTKLGANYQNSIFVGDNNNGNLYFFKVNKDRSGIEIDNSTRQSAGLSDLVVDNDEELSAITFGTGFGSITNIKTGPDGFLYVLSFDDGSIYRISPSQ
jgi:glucose/arabinose dehydrogenase